MIWMATYGDKKPVAKVSKWFTEEEVAFSDTAIRLGIDNTPPEWVLENARETGVHVMDPIREHHGIPHRPNSWYRCEQLEKAICWEKGFRIWCAKRNLPWITRHELYKNMEVQKSWDKYFERKQHPTGMAVDHEIATVDNDELFFWIRDNLEFDQLIREFPKPGVPSSGWVHVSWAGVQANRQTYFSIPSYDRYI